MRVVEAVKWRGGGKDISEGGGGIEIPTRTKQLCSDLHIHVGSRFHAEEEINALMW